MLAEPTNRVSKKLKASVELESKSDSNCTDVVPIVTISEELASFFGTDEREISQAEALRQIWEYIKVNQLEVGNQISDLERWTCLKSFESKF